MILDDAEQAVLDVVEGYPLDAGGVFEPAALVSAARGRSSFGEERLRQATATLLDKGMFLPLDDGRLQVAGPARTALAERAARR